MIDTDGNGILDADELPTDDTGEAGDPLSSPPGALPPATTPALTAYPHHNVAAMSSPTSSSPTSPSSTQYPHHNAAAYKGSQAASSRPSRRPSGPGSPTEKVDIGEAVDKVGEAFTEVRKHCYKRYYSTTTVLLLIQYY